MSNDFYNHNDGVPATLTRGASTTLRSEFDLVQAGFDKLPSLVQTFGGSANYVVAGGSADAWTASVAPTVLTSYVDGLELRVMFPAGNTTTAPTLNLNALGPKVIVSEQGASINPGDIVAGEIATLIYNATYGKFQMALGNSVASAQASAAAASTQAGIATTGAATATAQAGIAATQAGSAATQAGVASAAAGAALAAAHIYASTAAAQGDGTLANGSYYAVPQASPSTTFYDLYIKVSNVASTYVNTFPSLQAISDQILKLTASVGYVYQLGTQVAYGTTAPNASTAAGTHTYLPLAVTAERGYLVDVSVRAAAGTGEIVVLTPDPVSSYGFIAAAVAPVTVTTGVNTFLGANIYGDVLPAGSRIGYRILTGGLIYAAGTSKKIDTVGQTVGQELNGSLQDVALLAAVAFNIRPAATTSLDRRLADVEAGIDSRGLQVSAMLGAPVSAPNTTYGSIALAATGDLSPVTRVYAVAPTTAPCVLSSVSIKCSNPSADPDLVTYPSKIALGQMDSTGNIIVTDIYPIYLAAGKTNVISGFGEKVLPAGTFVMLVEIPSHTPIQYKTGTTDGGGYTAVFAGTVSVGSAIPLVGHTDTVIMSYTVRQPTNALPARLSLLGLNQGTTNPVALERTEFPGAALPTGWTASGAWTVSNGLTPPAVGGWGVKALSPTYSTIFNRALTARITINSADTITGICTSPSANGGGAAVMIDGPAVLLKIYSWDDTGAAGTQRASVALPAALTAGRDYVVEVLKTGLSLTANFLDTVTQQSCTVTLDGSGTYTMAHGKCGALFISATTPPKYQWLEYLAPYYRRLRALVIADSIGEGAYLGAASPTWAAQLAAARSTQRDFMIAPRAGDTSIEFLKRKPFDLDPWLPQFVVIALGTNDADQNLWRYNVAAVIAKAVSLGAEPILCTQVPKTAAQALRTAMNSDIRSGYFGRYRYIDMAIAVSNAHDGVTWNAAYDFGDGIHPNAAGQNKMYAQALIDAPFLTR